MKKRFDTRKVKKLSPGARYGELYFYFREAEQMIASNFPDAQRHGRRLKRKVENLYAQWFGQSGQNIYGPRASLWAAG
ncbi:MAG TPA: hypothetical protein VLT36_08305 [Candidatus Dormibacteraeota bacterium]|nr:hypothetical protein [Candidatus Dormibacteraeota bacterium]